MPPLGINSANEEAGIIALPAANNSVQEGIKFSIFGISIDSSRVNYAETSLVPEGRTDDMFEGTEQGDSISDVTYSGPPSLAETVTMGANTGQAKRVLGTTRSFSFATPEPKQDLEVDFDQNPTTLFSLIHEREWKAAINRLEYFPDEARIFVYRKGADCDIRWRLLPLHAAILMSAPASVIQALCHAYPKAAKRPDDTTDLPIHLAVRKHVDEETLNLLLQAFPASIDVQNAAGQTPLDLAKQSSSPYKDYYLDALHHGRLHSRITANILSEILFCGFTLPFFGLDEVTGNHGTLAKSANTMDSGHIKKFFEDTAYDMKKIDEDMIAQYVDDAAKQTNLAIVGTVIRAANFLSQLGQSNPNDQLIAAASKK